MDFADGAARDDSVSEIWTAADKGKINPMSTLMFVRAGSFGKVELSQMDDTGHSDSSKGDESHFRNGKSGTVCG